MKEEELKQMRNQYESVTEYISRGLFQCTDNFKEGILVLGMNPSYPQKTAEDRQWDGIDHCYSFAEAKNKYFDSLKEILGQLYDKAGYLDLFPIKESNQQTFTDDIIKNDTCLGMLAEMVGRVQHEIEKLKPKLIILKNKQLPPFMGKGRYIWMGYQLEKVTCSLGNKHICLSRIVGMKSSDNVGHVKETALIGTLVLGYGLYDARHKKTCPNRILDASDIQKLWEMANKKENH